MVCMRFNFLHMHITLVYMHARYLRVTLAISTYTVSLSECVTPCASNNFAFTAACFWEWTCSAGSKAYTFICKKIESSSCYECVLFLYLNKLKFLICAEPFENEIYMVHHAFPKFILWEKFFVRLWVHFDFDVCLCVRCHDHRQRYVFPNKNYF